MGDGSSAGAAREPGADDPSTKGTSISTLKPDIRPAEEEQQPPLGPPAPLPECVVLNSGRGGEFDEGRAVDSGLRDQLCLLSGDRTRVDGAAQRPLDGERQRPRWRLRVGERELSGGRAARALAFLADGEPRVEQQVRRDPLRPAQERIAIHPLPDGGKQRRPDPDARTRLTDEPLGETLETGKQGLQNDAAGPRVGLRAAQQRRERGVLGVQIRIDALQEADEQLRTRKGREPRLPSLPLAQSRGQPGSERWPLSLEGGNDVELGHIEGAPASGTSSGHEPPSVGYEGPQACVRVSPLADNALTRCGPP